MRRKSSDYLLLMRRPSRTLLQGHQVDACFVIMPDMVGLTGAPEMPGIGAGGTAKGAKVCISAAEMPRSTADVYLCRKDFFDANHGLVEKRMVAYLKGCQAALKMRKQVERRGSESWMAL